MQFDNSSPIWLQLVDESIRRVVTGRWPPGGRIPVVRDLAVELGVNPNTVQRAMAELDRMGVTIADRTRGRCVTEDLSRIEELREEIAAARTDDFVGWARGVGLSLAAVTELLEARWRAMEGE
ncbi:GntR family transcriptional regulator [Tessaracoccus sp. OH4464_COT-324]|uniref:GntR family transcriptional regulator n=1 Tax=Tessaracoccus sp. OH4464_COT-324 TaxID=2491059 RepID=UPI000F62F3FA|nr:GntR family transcriptional regulator [Tessaracoccus sp. OH4464_COT-324]RRD47815.1 GntR family transcriptional regulator [Tessaracoccus sp. OH4464_COT-324]